MKKHRDIAQKLNEVRTLFINSISIVAIAT